MLGVRTKFKQGTHIRTKAGGGRGRVRVKVKVRVRVRVRVRFRFRVRVRVRVRFKVRQCTQHRSTGFQAMFCHHIRVFRPSSKLRTEPSTSKRT